MLSLKLLDSLRYICYLCDSLLNHLNTIVLLQLDSEGISDSWAHWRKDTLLADLAVKDLHDSHGAWNADQLGHGAVALWIAVLAEGRCPGLLLSVGELNIKLVLEHDKVTLTLLVLHLLLQVGADGVNWGTTGFDLVVGEDTEPLQAGDDAVLFLVVGKLCLGADGPDKVAVLLLVITHVV